MKRLSPSRIPGVLALGLACAAPLAGHAAARWATSMDGASGLPGLEVGGAKVVTPTFAFFGANWSWAGLQTTLQPAPEAGYELKGASKPLGLALEGRVAQTPSGGWSADLHFHDGAGVPVASGGGMIFRFDLGNWGAAMGEPELLPGNAGWRWGKPGGPGAEMRFDPPLPAVYFEKGNKAELRAFFFQGAIPAGDHDFKVTWQTHGIATLPPLSERYGGPPPDRWPLDTPNAPGALPDLGFLNRDDRPAGRHGAVRAVGDQLQFADGTPARFWGTNVVAYALFATPHDVVKAQAHRLAMLGYNLVRLHHIDSAWVNPNLFGKPASITDTQTIDPAQQERLDWWVKCLEDEGIYVWIDLHDLRAFKAGDHIDGFDEIRKGKDSADLKGYSYVNPSIQEAMKRFDAAYLGHRNAFTGVALKDDPAVVAALLTNENDVTQHFGNALLPDKNVPIHDKLYMADAQDFAHRSGLPANTVWHAWEPGAPRIFLNDLEHRFDVDQMGELRRLGAHMPVVTTNSWGSSPISALPALTTGDMIDVHAYTPAGALERDPAYAANLADWMGASQVVGYPLSVTEWNAEPFPGSDRQDLPLYIAATASHQGWAALMHYAYAQESLDRNTPSNWNGYDDPSLIAMMPAAALLYRERHVALATKTYVFRATSDDFFGKSISAGNSPALRGALEIGRLMIAMPDTPALPWLKRRPLPAGAIVLDDPAKSILPPDATEASSDTGELKRNWSDGIFTIATPLTRAAMGWIGKHPVTLDDVDIRLTTLNACVAVQSLDGTPVGKSKELLVSIGTRSQPQPGNKLPFRVEGAAGSLAIRAPAGLKVYGANAGGKVVEWPAAYRDGRYDIQLDGATAVHWLTIRKPD